MSSLWGKEVIITGGSRGIGQAISRLLAAHGAKIRILYKSDETAATETIGSLAGDGHQSIQCDITDADGIKSFFEAFGGDVDILINNAGVAFHHPIYEESYESWQNAWEDILNLNLKSIANTCYLAAQQMKHLGQGRIINISSRGAFRGEPLMPAYGASKAGLNSMTQSLAHYLAPFDIFVGAIAPGFVETDMSRPRLQGDIGAAIKAQSPLNRVAQPQEIAQAVLTMCQAPLWMTGSIFDANGASYFRV